MTPFRPLRRRQVALCAALALLFTTHGSPSRAQGSTPAPSTYQGDGEAAARARRRRERAEEELRRGRAHAAAGHDGLAVDYFNAAIRIDPSAVAPHLELGRALLRLNRASDALAVLERGVSIHPRDVDLRRALADAWLTRGAPRRALAVVREAHLAAPFDATLVLLEAEFAERVGALLLAASDYAEVLEAYREGGDVSEAQADLARTRLRALGILLGDRHPAASACAQSTWRHQGPCAIRPPTP